MCSTLRPGPAQTKRASPCRSWQSLDNQLEVLKSNIDREHRCFESSPIPLDQEIPADFAKYVPLAWQSLVPSVQGRAPRGPEKAHGSRGRGVCPRESPARRSKEVEVDTLVSPIQGTPIATIPTFSQGGRSCRGLLLPCPAISGSVSGYDECNGQLRSVTGNPVAPTPAAPGFRAR